MAEQNRFNHFCEDLKQKVNLRCDIEGEENFKVNSFTEEVVDYLVEAEELEDAHVFYHKAKGVQVNGYFLNENNDSLDLIVSIHQGITPPSKLSKSEINSTLKRVVNFFEKSLKNYYLDLEESTEAFDLAKLIHDIKDELQHIKIFLISDQIINKDNFEFVMDVQGIDINYYLWDIERIYNFATSGEAREKIEINLLDQFDQSLPALKMTAQDGSYTSYLMIISGEQLMKIYDKYGSRLLERNVRSYLQAKGSVNKGIKTTIANEPSMFLAYNNGLSATAESVELQESDNGIANISAIKDLQIVNGGQTTASIYASAKKDKKDISQVYVQMKLTVVGNPEKMDEIVPRISEYANSQNKIQMADFSANDPFHRKIEELSRIIWAPAKDGSQKDTRWFYERARGQYNDEKSKHLTPSKVKQFEKEYPPKQVFTKTDLAKYENTWNQRPHIVSRGAQASFKDLTIQLKERKGYIPDEKYFQHLVAKAILFKRTEKLISDQNYGGYRANIVTYTLAWIVYKCAQRINLDKIWKEQSLSEALEAMIVSTSKKVHEYIIHAPNGANVTQWCKKDQCWKGLQEIELEISKELQDELLEYGNYMKTSGNKSIETADEEEVKIIQEVMKISSTAWYNIHSWAKETGNLAPWQLGIIVSLGKLASRSKEPSRKQAVQAKKILECIQELGFDMTKEIS